LRRQHSNPRAQRCAVDRRWPPHDHEARALEALDKALGDDLGHELVGVVDALAALEAEREGERRGEVGGSAGVRRSVGSGIATREWAMRTERI